MFGLFSSKLRWPQRRAIFPKTQRAQPLLTSLCVWLWALCLRNRLSGLSSDQHETENRWRRCINTRQMKMERVTYTQIQLGFLLIHEIRANDCFDQMAKTSFLWCGVIFSRMTVGKLDGYLNSSDWFETWMIKIEKAFVLLRVMFYKISQWR